MIHQAFQSPTSLSHPSRKHSPRHSPDTLQTHTHTPGIQGKRYPRSIQPYHSNGSFRPATTGVHTPSPFTHSSHLYTTRALALYTLLSFLHALTCGSPQTRTDGGGDSCHCLNDSKSPCPHPLRFRGVRYGEPHLGEDGGGGEKRRGETRRGETRKGETRREETRRGENLLH